jgi:hypothetical protein
MDRKRATVLAGFFAGLTACSGANGGDGMPPSAGDAPAPTMRIQDAPPMGGGSLGSSCQLAAFAPEVAGFVSSTTIVGTYTDTSTALSDMQGILGNVPWDTPQQNDANTVLEASLSENGSLTVRYFTADQAIAAGYGYVAQGTTGGKVFFVVQLSTGRAGTLQSQFCGTSALPFYTVGYAGFDPPPLMHGT